MTVTEQARHRLHVHLEEIMGEEHAAALMEWAPNGPLASREDVARLREAMDARFEAMDARFEAMDARFEAMDARFEAVAARFDAVDSRFDAVDSRFDAMATKEDVANLRAEMHNTVRLHTIVLVGALGTMISIARIF